MERQAVFFFCVAPFIRNIFNSVCWMFWGAETFLRDLFIYWDAIEEVLVPNI